MGAFAPHILADQLILLLPKGVGGSDNAQNVVPRLRIFIPSAGSDIVYFRIRLTGPEKIHLFIINCI